MTVICEILQIINIELPVLTIQPDTISEEEESDKDSKNEHLEPADEPNTEERPPTLDPIQAKKSKNHLPSPSAQLENEDSPKGMIQLPEESLSAVQKWMSQRHTGKHLSYHRWQSGGRECRMK